MVKALWAYEPWLRQRQYGSKSRQFGDSLAEEKEAIVKCPRDHQKLKHVNDIIDKGLFRILSCMKWLGKKHPEILVLLPREQFYESS